MSVSPAWGVFLNVEQIQPCLKVISLLAKIVLCRELTHLCLKFVIQIWSVRHMNVCNNVHKCIFHFKIGSLELLYL